MDKKSMTRHWHVEALITGSCRQGSEGYSGACQWAVDFPLQPHFVTNERGNYCSKGSALTHIADLIPRNTQHWPISDIVREKHLFKCLLKTDVWEFCWGILKSSKKI